MEKIKCIVKRPDEKYGHVTYVSNSLKNLQNTVDGNIEVIRLPNGVAIVCNEEGKLLDLPHNFNIKYISEPPCEMFHEEIAGTVIVCGVNDDEFCDIPITLSTWKEFLEAWFIK